MAKGNTAPKNEAPAEDADGVTFGGEGEESGFLVDLSGVSEDAGFPVLPRGIYSVTVDNLEFGMSSAGNPMWTWRFEVTDGDFAGQKLFYHSVFTEKNLPRVRKILMALGASELLEGPFNPPEIASSGMMLGRDLRVRVDVRPYEGRQTNNVRDVLPPTEGAGFLD